MSKQLLFPSFEKLKVKSFGGGNNKSNPREARPLSIKRPIHLVLKSSYAIKEKSFLENTRSKRIRELLYRSAKRSGVKIYRYASSGNHLHLIIQAQTRNAYHKFIRAITGLIARITLGAEKGRAKNIKFWDARPFTRILEWGRDFKKVCIYLEKNILIALGFTSEEEIKSFQRFQKKQPYF